MNYDLDYAQAEKDFARRASSDELSRECGTGLGLLRAYQGRVEEAFEYLRRARELESTQLLYSG